MRRCAGTAGRAFGDGKARARDHRRHRHHHAEDDEQRRAARRGEDLGVARRNSTANTPSAPLTDANSRCGCALRADGAVRHAERGAGGHAAERVQQRQQCRRPVLPRRARRRPRPLPRKPSVATGRPLKRWKRGAEKQLASTAPARNSVASSAGLLRVEAVMARSACPPTAAARRGRPCRRSAPPSARRGRGSCRSDHVGIALFRSAGPAPSWSRA